MKTSSILKRMLVGTMISLTLLISATQCFGGFAITKKLYGFNKSIMAGDGSLGARFVRTIVLWVMVIIPVYGIGMLVDAIILNLIEFWTGRPLVALTDSNEKVSFHQINENELRIDIKGARIASFHVFRDRPGEFFVKEGSDYIPVTLPEDIKAFDATGRTEISCERTVQAIKCTERKNDQAFVQAEIRQTDYERLQYRTRLALGIGAEAASR